MDAAREKKKRKKEREIWATWRITCTELNPNHMLEQTTISPSQPATLAGHKHQSRPTKESLSLRYAHRSRGKHFFDVVSFEFIILESARRHSFSRIGLTDWYPARGSDSRIRLEISNSLHVVFATAGAISGCFFINSPFYSWGTLAACRLKMCPPTGGGDLMGAPPRIDSSMGQRPGA